MVRAPGIAVPPREAETTRRLLAAEGRLRTDLAPAKVDGAIVFPTLDDDGQMFEFQGRETRADRYQDLLPWPEERKEQAPRAFDVIGDIAVVKIPPQLDRPGDAEAVGEALCTFLGARAVFHDRGVKGTFRVRDLVRIGGAGGSETTVKENGLRLTVDVGRAYYSPRLADERARVAALVQPGERFVDLFGGCAPMALQAARKGAKVVTIDLNPVAVEYAATNAQANKLDLDARCGDAREVAATLEPADRILMNLPHGARDFLDVAAALAAPGAMVHFHEIMPDADLDAAREAIVAELAAHGRRATIVNVRHVRNYSAQDSHYALDIRIQ